MNIGVISDTHGLLRPEVQAAFAGVECILHAGDVGELYVLEALRRIAPTHAVRGNMDRAPWSDALPLHEALEIGGIAIYMVHRPEDLDVDEQSFGLVVFGHTHRAELTRKGRTLMLNPGSASTGRGGYPPSVAIVHIDGDTLSVRHIELPE